MKNDFVFIEHVLDSINAIKEFSRDISKEELISNRLKQSALIREIEIIGEAVRNISEDLKRKNKEIGWKDIVGARDKMIHHYFSIDMNIIWKIVKNDIPILEKQMQVIKKKLMKNK